MPKTKMYIDYCKESLCYPLYSVNPSFKVVYIVQSKQLNSIAFKSIAYRISKNKGIRKENKSI